MNERMNSTHEVKAHDKVTCYKCHGIGHFKYNLTLEEMENRVERVGMVVSGSTGRNANLMENAVAVEAARGDMLKAFFKYLG
jgi:hypothetical protein